MSKPLRIAIVSHQVGRYDGQGRVNYEIACGAVAAGWGVTIVGMRCAEDIAAHPAVKFIRFDVEKWPTQVVRNFAFAAASARWIKAHRHDHDILHVNGCLTWANSDINAAHFVHGAWMQSPFYPFKSWWRSPYAAYQRFYSSANARSETTAFHRTRSVVAVSKKVASELRSIGVPEDKISVIYNGVDTDEFRPGPSERGRFGLPEQTPLFLFAGDIRTPRKNLDTVLSALLQVPELHLAVAGAIAGSPFPEMVQNLGLAERVHFLDKVREMPALMRSVDAFVFPSRYECMSLVLLEALASGLPVLTAQTAGGAEIIGLAGRVLENPDDRETLAAWMRELKDSPELRQSMGEQARAIALAHNWQSMATQYRELYTRVKWERVEQLRNAMATAV